MSQDWGGYWTEVKLQVLQKYVAGFNRAAQSAGATVYLDLFAGQLHNRRPDTGAEYLGSSGVAMGADPPFTKLVFWDLEPYAARLRRDLGVAYSGDSRWEVFGQDCNLGLDAGLRSVATLQWAPTFAFIDPKGLDVAWTTLERLSKWRRGKTKVELWILFPEPALARVLGLQGVRGKSSADRLSRLFGSDDWVAIHQRRRSGELSPGQMRAEFVNLLRWRLEHSLQYKRTHALALGNVSGQPVYTMVFATDHTAGSQIMGDVYQHAAVTEIPEMRAQAVGARERRREAEHGIQTLFDVAPEVAAADYEHIEPWEPPSPIDQAVVLADEPPDDEDDSDLSP